VEQHLQSNIPYHDKVNNAYKSMFTWIMDGRNPDKNYNRKAMQHPNGGQKWLWAGR
jgi:hypothetical protein